MQELKDHQLCIAEPCEEDCCGAIPKQVNQYEMQHVVAVEGRQPDVEQLQLEEVSRGNSIVKVYKHKPLSEC